MSSFVAKSDNTVCPVHLRVRNGSAVMLGNPMSTCDLRGPRITYPERFGDARPVFPAMSW